MMNEKEERVLTNYIGIYNYNVQVVRFVCAVLVIISHAHPLGDGSKDFLNVLTNQKVSLGSLAVHILFYLSGLYICRSFLQKNENVTLFVRKRIEKLWLPLALVIISSVFFVGILFTSLDIKEYLCNQQMGKYFLNLVFILQYELPGVFVDNMYNNPAAVNGALWTLPLEILCYIAMVIALKTKLLSGKRSASFSLFEITGLFFIAYFIVSKSSYARYEYHLRIFYIFFLGVFTYLYAGKIFFNKKISIALFILLIMGMFSGYCEWVLLFSLPYMVITVFFMSNKKNLFSTLGNYTYEMYLCGFVIQQSIVALFGGTMNPYLNMIICIPLDIFFGVLLARGVKYLYGLKRTKG